MAKLKVTFSADLELELSAEDLKEVESLGEEERIKNTNDVISNMFENDDWDKVRVNVQKVNIEK